jgi:WD40 repeat protein
MGFITGSDDRHTRYLRARAAEIAAGDSGQVVFHDGDTSYLRARTVIPGAKLLDFPAGYHGVAGWRSRTFSPEGVPLVASSDGRLCFAGGRDFARLIALTEDGWDLEEAILRERDGFLYRDAVFSPDNRSLAVIVQPAKPLSPPDRTGSRIRRPVPYPRIEVPIHLYELGSKKLHKLQTKAYGFRAITFTPNARILVALTDDDRIIAWDLTKRKRQWEWKAPQPLRSLAIAPDGRHIAAGTAQGTVLLLRVKSPGRNSP